MTNYKMQDLNRFISDGLLALDYKREPQGLYAPIAYTLESGGKRVRPLLALIAAQMCDGSLQNVMPAALALEVFHNFTLLHDDLMDNADTRRGQPTVHKKWNNNTAILSGDQMLIESYKIMQDIPSQYLSESMMLFTKMATEICEGQQYDIDYEKQSEVSIDEYINMIRLKTAVLPATSLQLGALISGANTDIQTTLYQIGINLGLAFQLRDDYLDVYGNPETFGKNIGGDILDNKKTFIYIVAHHNANAEQNILLDKAFALTEPAQKIKEVTQLYTLTEADKMCLEQIDYYHQLALQQLNTLQIPEEKKTGLYNILQQLLKRDK